MKQRNWLLLRSPLTSWLAPVALTLPAGAGLLVFFIAPLAGFFAYSFMTAGLFSVSGPTTLDAYRNALSSSVNGRLALNSLVVGVCAAGITVALGLPISYWLRYAAGRLQVLVLFLVTATIFASYLVRLYAWRTILGDKGLINSGLERLGLIDQPLGFLLFNRFAVTVALVHIFLPYVVLVLYAGFRPIAPAYIEAAKDLGANGPKLWLRLILPLVAAPMATAFLFVFVLSASDYVTPQFLGGTGGALLGLRIQAVMTGVGNWPLGSALSFAMLVAFVICYVITTAGLRLLRLDRIRFVN